MAKVFFPTSMDPFHRGHHEAVQKFRRHHEQVVVGLGVNPEKAATGLFSVEDRLTIARLSLPDDVEVVRYEGLTLVYAQSIGAEILARSLRAGSDLDYEAKLQFQNESIALERGYHIDTLYALGVEYPRVSSTKIRELLKIRAGREALRRYLCDPAVEWMLDVYYPRLSAGAPLAQ